MPLLFPDDPLGLICLVLGGREPPDYAGRPPAVKLLVPALKARGWVSVHDVILVVSFKSCIACAG